MANSLDQKTVSKSQVAEMVKYAAQKGVKLYNGLAELTATSDVAPNKAMIDRAKERDCSIYWNDKTLLFWIAAKRGGNNKPGSNGASVPTAFSINDVAEQLRRWLEVYGCNTRVNSPMHHIDEYSIMVNSHQVSFDVCPPTGNRQKFVLEVKLLNNPTK